jgi:hypothetical protein
MMDQDMSIRIEGSPRLAAQRQDMKMHFEIAQEVKGPVANGTELSFRITSVDLQMPDLPNDVRAAASKMLVGVEMRFVYDERMRVQEAGVSMGGETQSLGRLTGSLQGLAFPFPEQPLREGQSWDGEVASPLGRMPGVDEAVKVRYNIRLARIRQSAADTVARFEIEVSFPTEPIRITEGGTTANVTIAGSLKGDMEYSVTRSALVHTGLNGTIRMTSDKKGQEGTVVVDQRLEMLLLESGSPL